MSDDNKSSEISVLLTMGKIVEMMDSKNGRIDSEGMEELNITGGSTTNYGKRLQDSGLAESISGKALKNKGIIEGKGSKQPGKKKVYQLTPRGRKFLEDFKKFRKKLEQIKNYETKKANISDETKLEDIDIIKSAEKRKEEINVDENNRNRILSVIKKYHITIDIGSIISFIDESIKYKKSPYFNNYEINTENLRKHGSQASFTIDLKGFTDDERQELKSFLNKWYNPKKEFQLRGSKIKFELGNVVKGRLPEDECCTETKVDFGDTWVRKDESKLEIDILMTIEKNLG